mgnify:CR=1 FL=1
MTTYQSAYSRQGKEGVEEAIRSERELRERGSGLGTPSDLKVQGPKMISVLTGEQYRDFEDPQHNTHCQRTWVYGGDNTLKVADSSLRNTIQGLGGVATPEDIMKSYRINRNPKARIGDGPTSLPLESTLR